MKLSRQLAITLMALGLQLGNLFAQAPEPITGNDPRLLPLRSDPAVAAPLPQVTDLASACCPGASDACCPKGGGVLAGVGFYILQPYFNNNMAFGLQTTTGRVQAGPNAVATVPGTRNDERVEIKHHMEVAPLIWLGYLTDSGFGGRVRWWYFRQGTEQFATGTHDNVNGNVVLSAAPLGLSLLNGAGTRTMAVTSKLQLQVWDFDTLYHLPGCKWDLLFIGGLRLASLDQTYNAYTGGESLSSSNVFSGIGPTLGLEARRRLGCSGLNLYGAARGSILFGSAHQIAHIPTRTEVAQEHRDIGMPVAEGELGLEYGRNVGASRLFGQIALVGQEWFGAGGASRSSTDVIPGGAFSRSSHVSDSDLGFLGLLIRAGVNY